MPLAQLPFTLFLNPSTNKLISFPESYPIFSESSRLACASLSCSGKLIERLAISSIVCTLALSVNCTVSKDLKLSILLFCALPEAQKKSRMDIKFSTFFI